MASDPTWESDAAEIVKAAAAAFNNSDYERAEALCDQVLSRDPGYPNALRILGLVEKLRGNHARGVELLEAAIKKSSTNPEAHFDLGRGYEAVGDYFRAAASFKRAWELAPTRNDFRTRYIEAVVAESHAAQGLPIVGRAAQKTYLHKRQSGFFEKYLSGSRILDIGFRGDLPAAQPIVAAATGIDMGYPGYDGVHLPFPDRSQDGVYSSHCLEHVEVPIAAIREWHRVLKVGGFMVVAVPHQFLYERKKQPPSLWNYDHKHFFTPGTLLAVVEQALAPNSYRLRHLSDNDFLYDYAAGLNQSPSSGYEIEMVLERIEKPAWTLI